MFNVGDEVIIRNDIEENCVAGHVKFVTRMDGYKGERTTIRDAVDDSLLGRFYNLDIDDGRFMWMSEWLIPAIDIEAPDMEGLESMI